MATGDEMKVASDEAINELHIMMRDDPEFDKAMRKLGKFLKARFMRTGYKHIARFIKDLQ